MELKALLKVMVDKRASDLHVRSNKPAVLRVDGQLISKTPQAIPGDQVESWIKSFLNEAQVSAFESKLECDLALTVEGLGRFRVNVYRQRGVINIAFRLVPSTIASFEQLRLPAVISKIADEPRG